MATLVSSIFAFGVVLPVDRIAAAAVTPEGLPQTATPADPVAAVGTLPGAVAVNPLGSAIYTLPLDLPATRGGLMPPLALVNSPEAGIGQYGYGWSLSGISVIDKCHVSNGEFGYCLDGSPLVPVGSSQRSFDCDNGDPDCVAGLEEYRTYPDSGLRVSRVPDVPTGFDPGVLPVQGARWKVESPSGRVSQFENCKGTCVESFISDSHGNYIEIDAAHNDDVGLVVNAIHYEGNLVTGEAPTHSILFHENGIEVPGRYYWFHRAPYDGCGPDDVTPTHGCAPTTQGSADGTGHPLLSSVTVCSGEFPAEGSGPTACIPPTRFQYTQRPDRLEWTGFDHNIGIPEDPCHGPFYGDFDGDGKTDAIWGADGCSSEALYF